MQVVTSTLKSLNTDVFDSQTSTGSHYFDIAINAHALKCLTISFGREKRMVDPSVLFLETMYNSNLVPRRGPWDERAWERGWYNSEIVTSGWRPWIKTVCAWLPDNYSTINRHVLFWLHRSESHRTWWLVSASLNLSNRTISLTTRTRTMLLAWNNEIPNQ